MIATDQVRAVFDYLSRHHVASAQHSAPDLGSALKHRDSVTDALELIGRGEASEAAADDNYVTLLDERADLESIAKREAWSRVLRIFAPLFWLTESDFS